MAIQLPATAHPRRQVSAALFWGVASFCLLFAYLSLDERFLRDYWQHLASARAADELGDWLLARDVLTFTIAEEPIVNSDWLSQRLYLWMHRTGALPFVRSVNAVLLAAAFLVLNLAAYRRCRNSAAALIATVASAGCALQSLTLRPQSFSVVLACLVMGVLEISRRRDTLRPWLILVMAAWANLHGALPVGWALLALDRLERWQQARASAPKSPAAERPGSDAAEDRPWYSFWWVDVACLAAPFAHPQGQDLISHLLRNAARSRSREIMEWLPPAIGQPAGFFLVMSGAATLAACVWLFLRGRSGALAGRMAVRALLLGAPACASVRMVAWFGIGMAPLWAEGLAVVLGARTIRKRTIPALALAVPLALALALAALPWRPLPLPELPGAGERRGPIAAVAWMRDQDAGGRVWAPFDWGGTLEWELFGNVRLFADGRVHLFSDPLWEEYLRIEAGTDGALALLDHYRVEWVLLERGRSPALEEMLDASRQWRRVYTDTLASVFRRASKRNSRRP